MVEFIEDSYCGLYCGACEVQDAYRRALEGGREAAWDDLPVRFSEYIPRGEVRCRGCKTDDVFGGCAMCRMRACARERGVGFCFECGDYPCAIVREKEAAVERFVGVMPHAAAIVRDLADVERMGREAWFAERRGRWSCPSCGARTTWYAATCRSCGAALAYRG